MRRWLASGRWRARAGRGPARTAQSAVWLELRDRHGATEFSGYDHVEDSGELIALVADGGEVEAAEAGQTVQALFDRTPFYAESGGQAGDVGSATWPGGRAEVLDTQKQAGDLHVHVLKLLQGRLAPGQRVQLIVDPQRRLRTRSNHSAAHLVHAALRHVLGPHVAQKGQLVDGERMRFDFAHSGPLTGDEIDAIEAEVNAVIRQNVPAVTEEMAPDEAIAAGAIALFGEKYGDNQLSLRKTCRGAASCGGPAGGSISRPPRPLGSLRKANDRASRTVYSSSRLTQKSSGPASTPRCPAAVANFPNRSAA